MRGENDEGLSFNFFDEGVTSPTASHFSLQKNEFDSSVDIASSENNSSAIPQDGVHIISSCPQTLPSLAAIYKKSFLFHREL